MPSEGAYRARRRIELERRIKVKKLNTDAKLTAALVDNILMRSDGRSVTLKALLSRKRIVGSNRTNGCDQGMAAIGSAFP
jgi:hypothetical protein